MIHEERYHRGRCPSCRSIYQWPQSDALDLRDAECMQCEVPLVPTRRSAARRGEAVQDVEAEWLRRTVHPVGGPGLSGSKPQGEQT